jgi:hypothetical protein
MSRNGSGVYSLPSGSIIVNGDTSDAEDLNVPLEDIEADLNTPRPIVAGGTGAGSVSAALINLGLTSTQNVAQLIANTSFAYLTGSNRVTSGNIIQTRAEGFSYQVAASDATDHHLSTAGGVKLYVLPSGEGYNVKAFGATGDGVTNDAAAVQAAIDAATPTSGATPETGRVVYFPTGVYVINSTVETYSGVILEGNGIASVLKAGGSLTNRIVSLEEVDGSGQYRYAGVRNLSFEATGAIWAIEAAAANVLNCVFEDIYLDVGLGLALDTYTQATTVRHVVSVGPVNTILRLSGNFNNITEIDKEGGTGTTAGAYIELIGPDCDGNELKNLLIEGSGDASKCPIMLQDVGDLNIENLWNELSTTNGYTIEATNSTFTITGIASLTTFALGKIKLRSGSFLRMEKLNAASEDLDWQPYIDADGGSAFHADQINGRRGADTYSIAASNNKSVSRYVNENALATLPAGYSAVSTPDYASGQNLLINPSFEAGIYGWALSNSDTPTFGASEVGQGLMYQCVSSTGHQLTQNITIAAGQIGQPLTLRYVAKIVGASGGRIIPIIAGSAEIGQNYVITETGWQATTVTFRPASSGSLSFGLWWLGVSGSSTAYVDEFSLCAGDRGLINPAKFGSLELSEKTFLCATAAPTTGTWKRGDHVFNSAPSVGAAKGWICTVAGTPGTWVSEGNL